MVVKRFAIFQDLVPDDGVEDCQELPDAGDDGDFLGLSSLDEPGVMALSSWVASGGDKCGHVHRVADVGSSAADHAVAAPCPGIAIERRDADERGELAAVERAQFGQFGDEGARRDRPYSGNRGQKLFCLAPSRRSPHIGIDVDVDFCEFLLEEAKMAVDFP